MGYYGNKKQIMEELYFLLKEQKRINIAIDGEWGIGKSYLINELITNDTNVYAQNFNENNTLVIDAWELSVLKTLDNMIKLTMLENKENEIRKNNAKGMLTEKSLEIFKKIIEETTDIALNGRVKKVLKTIDDLKDKGNFDVDDNFDFLKEMKNEYGIDYIFVDELDRTIPEIAIQIFKEINFINRKKEKYPLFIISTNLSAFESSLKHLYGETYDAGAFFDKTFDIIINMKADTREKVMYLSGSDAYYSRSKMLMQKLENISKLNFTNMTFRKLDLLKDDIENINIPNYMYGMEYLLLNIMTLKYTNYSDYIKITNTNINKEELFELLKKNYINRELILEIEKDDVKTYENNYYDAYVEFIDGLNINEIYIRKLYDFREGILKDSSKEHWRDLL